MPVLLTLKRATGVENLKYGQAPLHAQRPKSAHDKGLYHQLLW